jgi:hypothetical protein
LVKVSHYLPNNGGVNCSNFVNGRCVSRMANGESWEEYIGKNNTIACPLQVPFGTVILVNNTKYTCRDRGGAITIENGVYWIDILGEPIAPYATVMDAILIR